MNAEQRNTYRCFRRVQEFLANQPITDSPAAYGKQLTELDSVVSQLSKETLDQEAGYRLTTAESARQRGLRHALWDRHMLPVSRVAREVFDLTGMDRALRLPKRTAAHESLVVSAGAMAEAAESRLPVFIEHGLSQDFATQFRAAAAALDKSLGARDSTRRRRVTATAAVKDQLKRGQRAVRLLDAILKPKLSSNPDLLAAWNNVRKLKPASSATSPSMEEAPVQVVKAA
jgi:hypothetical protein